MKLKQIREMLYERKQDRPSDTCPTCKQQIHGKSKRIYIYHRTDEGDSIPGYINFITGGKTEKFVNIHADFLDGTTTKLVKANTLTLQETIRP